MVYQIVRCFDKKLHEVLQSKAVWMFYLFPTVKGAVPKLLAKMKYVCL